MARAHRPSQRQSAARKARPAGPLRDASPADRSTTDPAAVVEPGRGREAERPAEIPMKGWKDILLRSWKEFTEDQIPLVAAGVTFYVLLALFPAMAAFVALYGLFADVAAAQEHLQTLAAILPPDTLTFVGEQMVRISAAREGGLSFAFVFGLLLSIWSANGATKAVITAMNIAYDETEKRGLIARTLTSLAFTLAFVVFGVCAVAAIALPAAIEPYAGANAATLLRWMTWPLLAASMGVGLAVLYRYAPSRDRVKWRWITWGSAGALVSWLALSAGFSIYVAQFANYERTYGALGTIVGLMMWVYLSTQLILAGAELNAELEHQTAKDTTTGAPGNRWGLGAL